MKRQVILGILLSCTLSAMASGGTIMRQEWNESISSSRQAIIDFLGDLANPVPTPDIEEVMTESFYHGDHKDNYVAKFYGWITVPETGTYQFHYACDDYGMLYVSQDEKMENAVEVAYVDGWCADAEWNKYPDTQHSDDMQLRKGQILAVMAFFQEAGGGDNMDIGWTGPGLSSDPTDPTYVTDWITHIPPVITIAKDPVPASDAVDFPRDGVLSWEPSLYAVTHDVYFGTAFDDVNDATRADPRGVLLSQDQSETTFDPPGILNFEQVYYWRIDEVNGAPDYDIHKGPVWSFTAEPWAYPIEGVVATSNLVSETGKGPDKAVDGSGLDENGGHSTDTTDMWSGSIPEGETGYIQFDFDRVYKLDEIVIWNYNMEFEAFMGVGIKEATIEYTENGTDWIVFGDVELAQGPGMGGSYVANNMIPFDGVPAKAVRLTIVSGYGMSGIYGLSEVQFMYIPAHAREPEPADGATNVTLDTALAWRAGREAASHEVYLSNDPNALTLAGTVTQSSFDAALDLNTLYYWRVDEVNQADAVSTWEGDVWEFMTQEYIEVDGFDTYNDEAGTTIWDAWLDGLVEYGGDPANGGSQVGHTNSPFAEQTIVRTGSQSMPLYFVNTSASGISEADLSFDSAQDWSVATSLSLWFCGALDNTGQLYVKINDTKVVYDGDAADIARPQWQPWNIDLSTVGANLSGVTTLSVGVQGTGNGIIYVDDIRLYGYEVEKIIPTEPDSTGLAAHYTFDEGAGTTVNDASGNGNTGTVEGTPSWVAGIVDGAMEFDGTVYVNCGNGPSLQIRDAITIAAWIKVDAFTVGWEAILAKGDNSYRMSRGNEFGDYLHFGCNGLSGGNVTGTSVVTTGTWRHAAAVYDGQYAYIYLDGTEDIRVASTGQIDESTNDLYIAENSGATGRQLGGLVDDVRIYNRALSPEEIAGLAGRTTPLYAPF